MSWLRRLFCRHRDQAESYERDGRYYSRCLDCEKELDLGEV